jgi:hypothetical protein
LRRTYTTVIVGQIDELGESLEAPKHPPHATRRQFLHIRSDVQHICNHTVTLEPFLSDLRTLFVHIDRGEFVIVARTRQLHFQIAQEPQKLLVGALFTRPHFEVDLLDEPIVEQNYVSVPVQTLLEDAASVSGRLRDFRLFANRSFSAYLELEEGRQQREVATVELVFVLGFGPDLSLRGRDYRARLVYEICTAAVANQESQQEHLRHVGATNSMNFFLIIRQIFI